MPVLRSCYSVPIRVKFQVLLYNAYMYVYCIVSGETVHGMLFLFVLLKLVNCWSSLQLKD